jgi:hypothetical protein
VDDRDDQGPLAFCVVANVTQWTAHGEGGLELQRGLRHFPPGAKVWVLPVMWGDGGANVIVVGHHRGTRGHGYTRMVIARRHLADFRVQGTYSPALEKAITAPWRDLELRLWGSRADAEAQAEYWRVHPVEAHADDWSLHQRHRPAAAGPAAPGTDLLPRSVQRPQGCLLSGRAAARTAAACEPADTSMSEVAPRLPDTTYSRAPARPMRRTASIIPRPKPARRHRQ